MVAGHLQIKKGNYYMVLNLHDEQGKRKSKWLPTGISALGKKNQKQAEEMLWETRHSYKDTVFHTVDSEAAHMTGNMLFSDYMLDWLGIIKNSVEEVTYAGYEMYVKQRIAPYFKKRGITLSGLTALDIEGFYEYCLNKLSLKGSTVQHFHANIHKALKYAVRHDLINVNPMDKVERPKSLPFTGSFYSIAEVDALFQAVKGDPVEFPVLMAAFYGLRRSEIMGLRWQAIDFENNTITIDHTVVQFRVGGKQRLYPRNEPKTSQAAALCRWFLNIGICFFS